MAGYIMLFRQLKENILWDDKPFSKGQAWIDLLFRANFTDAKILIGNTNFTLQRGQFVTSCLKLSEDWGWSQTKVYTFLNMLENESMIKHEKNNKFTVISIVKYDLYNDPDNTLKEQKKNKKISKEEQKNTDNNDKNKEEEINIVAQKKIEFAEMIKPFVEKFGKDLCNEFYSYWTEPNKSQTKIKWELERTFDINLRLTTFQTNAVKWNKQPIQPTQINKKNPNSFI